MIFFEKSVGGGVDSHRFDWNTYDDQTIFNLSILFRKKYFVAHQLTLLLYFGEMVINISVRLGGCVILSTTTTTTTTATTKCKPFSGNCLTFHNSNFNIPMDYMCEIIGVPCAYKYTSINNR